MLDAVSRPEEEKEEEALDHRRRGNQNGRDLNWVGESSFCHQRTTDWQLRLRNDE
jgi:hypothetical protein